MPEYKCKPTPLNGMSGVVVVTVSADTPEQARKRLAEHLPKSDGSEVDLSRWHIHIESSAQ